MRGDSEQGTLGSDPHIGSQGSLSRHASGNRMGRENRRSTGTHRAPQEGSHRLLIQGTSGRVGQVYWAKPEATRGLGHFQTMLLEHVQVPGAFGLLA